MDQFRIAPVAALLALSVLLATAAPVSAQPSGSEASSDLAASSGDAPPYPGFPDPEDPIVVENGGIRSGFDIFVDCRSDYRVLGEEQSRACYEAGYTPLNYPGPDAEGPFPAYPSPDGAAVPASPTELPDTGGAAAPALLGAGALLAILGLLIRPAARQ